MIKVQIKACFKKQLIETIKIQTIKQYKTVSTSDGNNFLRK
jgi:hypothetical protein